MELDLPLELEVELASGAGDGTLAKPIYFPLKFLGFSSER